MPRRFSLGIGSLLWLLMVVSGCSLPSATDRTPTPTFPPLPTPTATVQRPVPSVPPFATPTHTLSPEATGTPTAAPRPALSVLAAYFPEPPEADLEALVRAIGGGRAATTPVTTPRPRPASEQFTLIDAMVPATRTITADLVHTSEHAYWYVESGVRVSKQAIESAAKVFEERIRPSVVGSLGQTWAPGPDGDPRLTVLHARLSNVAGYYSSTDQYPKWVQPLSNERAMIYMDTDSLPVGAARYLSTLAHELQHAVHWAADRSEAVWVNEGLAEVTSILAGYEASWVDSYLRAPTNTLLNWSAQQDSNIPNYGAATLFVRFLMTHYGGEDALRRLMTEPYQSVRGVEQSLRDGGFETTFAQVYADWTVANLVGKDQGPYSYPGRKVQATVAASLSPGARREGSLLQYGVEYVELKGGAGQYRVNVATNTASLLFPTAPASGDRCWWSNRGDSISSTLTRGVDLSSVRSATLRYDAWYDIEEDWDYAYVQASTDGGATWQLLEPPGATSQNPVGNGLGHGYSGSSDGWVAETIDLTPFAGRRIQLRFHYLTDDAKHGVGLCLDNISIPELGFFDDTERDDNGWRTNGFVRAVDAVPQLWVARVVELADTPLITDIPLDANGDGSVLVTLRSGTRTVIVLSPMAPGTFERAAYILEFQSAS